MQKVAINVALKLDSREFSNRLDSLSKDFKPLEIPVRLNSLGLSGGIGGVKVKADLDPSTLTPSLTASLRTAFGSVTANLGEDIGASVGKSIEKLKPSAFSGIVGAIASPFQKIATGALEGVGREMSAKLGQGIARGVEKQVAPVIGSFDLLGEKLITTAAPRLGNTLGGQIASSLFNKDSVKQAQQDFKQFLGNTVGEVDILIATQSQKAKNKQESQTNLNLARQELGTQLADFVGNTPQRQQQVTQLRGRDAQLATQEQALQEQSKTSEKALADKRQELSKKQASIVKKLESQGVKVDDSVRRQVAKQVESAPQTQQELAALETNYARDLQSLTKILQQRKALNEKIKQLGAPLSPIVNQLELLGVKQSNIATIQERAKTSNAEFGKMISNINQGINENVTNIQSLRKDIAFYKKQLQQLVTDYEFQLNFVTSGQEKSGLLQQTIQQRKEIIQQIEQAEAEAEASIAKIKARQKLRQQTQQKNVSKQQEIENDYLPAQVKLAREAMGRSITPSNSPAKKPTSLITDSSAAKQDLPEIYRQIVGKIAAISGVQIKQSNIPTIGYDARVAVGGGAYDKVGNKVLLDKTAYEKLASGVVDKQLVENIAHELRHALQFEFGKNIKGTGVSYLQTNPEELARLNPRVDSSTSNVAAQMKGLSSKQKALTQKTELDAYTFADRYTDEIYNYVKGISNPKNVPSLKTKLTERQRELKSTRQKAQEQLFESLAAENKANLEQLTGAQLKAIARSSGVKNYSNKNVADLRGHLLQNINAEELAFRIPLFSKVDPSVQQDSQELLQIAPAQLKQQIKELSKHFSQSTKQAAKSQDAIALRQVLDGIAEARRVYASALALTLDKEARSLLTSAVGNLGKQRIAAQSRLTTLDSQKLNTNQRSGAASFQGVSDLQFSFPANPEKAQNKIDLSFATAQKKRIERSKPDLSFTTAKLRADEYEAQLKSLSQLGGATQENLTSFVKNINHQASQGIINADVALQKIASATRAAQKKQDKQAQKQNSAINKSSEASFKQAQDALKQIEIETNQQVAQAEARSRYKQQQQQRKQRDRLNSYGLPQTAPVDIVEVAPQRQKFSVGKVFNQFKSEYQDFRTSASRKQADALGQQAAAILVDLDSQIAIGKASATEAKVISKQITENEKRIQQILAKIKTAKSGKEPALTAGDLQRLSGEVQQLSAQIDQDKARIAELKPQIQKAKQLQPVAKDLQGSASRGSAIASQKTVTNEDLAKLNQFNQQTRESLKLLGQTPPQSGFFADLNLKMPELLKNTLSLVKGFLAFQVVSLVQQQLQQIGVEAFKTSMRFEALEKSLNFATGGDGAQSLEFVRKEVERLSLPLETSIKGFTGLAAAARGTSLEGAKTQKIFSAIAQSARVYNLTSEQTEGALLAVQQMISKGTVQAEELRGQLGERIPGAVQIFARAMGVSTAELGKLLEKGTVGLEGLDKFADQLILETSGGVESATKTAAASLQRLQNSFADLNKNIGDAISPAAIAVFDTLGTSMDFVQKNAKVVRAILAAIALTIVVALIPSITALGAALFTLATVALPAVAAAALAIVVANPVLIASLAALTVGMLLAEDGAKALSEALTGVSDSQIQQVDADSSLDFKYNQALLQLQKQIPLTKEQIDLLSNGLDDQAKRGVNTAKTSESLKNQLFKLQSQAQATAAAQDALNKAIAESEIAFKKAKGAAELSKSGSDLSIAQARAKGLLGDDAIKDKEYESEQRHNLNMSALYSSRLTNIKSELAESERLQKSGKKGIDAKKEKELREELINIQKEYNQVQTNLATRESDRLQAIRDRRLKDFDEAEQIQESFRKSGVVNEQSSIEALLEIRQSKAQEELAQIKERRAKLNKTDKEGLEALALLEAAVLLKMSDNRKSRFDEQFGLVKGATDRATAYTEAQRKRGLTSEQEAATQAIATATQSANAQVALIRQRLKEVPKTDTAKRDELLVQEQQAIAQVAEARKQGFERSTSAIKSSSEKRLAILLSDRSRGLITESQFNEQSFQETKRSLDEELQLIKERKKDIAATDIEGQLAIQSSEAENYKKRIDNQKAFVDAQLALVEREQQKASDLMAIAAKEREIELQKFINDRTLTSEEAALESLKIARTTASEELQLEKEKYAALAALPKYSDPIAESDRASKIRASRRKTAELTLQLLQNEKQQQEAVFAAISKAYERVNQAISNGATRFIQPLERQLQLSNALQKSSEIQNKLLEARKNLYNAINNYVSADLQILQDTATTEAEKKELAEAAANAKLEAARLQVDMDKQSLELQIKQTEIAQRRLEVENAIALIKNKADTTQKSLNLTKVNKDPSATPEQKQIAQLELETSVAEGVGLQEQQAMLAAERAANDQINNMRRRTQQLEAAANIRKAEYERANAIADPEAKRKSLERLRREASINVTGVDATKESGQYSQRLSSFNELYQGKALTPLQEYFANLVRNAIVPTLPEITLPQVDTNNAFSTHVDSFGTAVNTLMDFVSQKLTSPAQVNISVPVTNNIDSRQSGKDAVSNTTAEVRKQFYDLGMELNRR